MKHLAKFLEDILLEKARSASGQLFKATFWGPPDSAMDLLYDQLTSGGKANWKVGGGRDELVVCLIGTEQGSTITSIESQRSNWDYAVKIRNDERSYLFLSKPEAISREPDSVKNTSRSLGVQVEPEGKDLGRSWLWQEAIEKISSKAAIEKDLVKWALNKLCISFSRRLGLRLRAVVPWAYLDRLLSAKNAKDFLWSAGLFSIGGAAITSDELNSSWEQLRRFSDYLNGNGLMDGFDKLLRITDENEEFQDLNEPLDELGKQIAAKCGSAIRFDESIADKYHEASGDKQVWEKLTYHRIKAILDEINQPDVPAAGKLILEVGNAVNGGPYGRSNKSPHLVKDSVILNIFDQERNIPPGVAISRKSGSGQYIEIKDSINNGSYTDDDIPSHDKVLSYRADNDQSNGSNVVKVLSIDSYDGVCYGQVPNAVDNPEPRKIKDGYEQKIKVNIGGNHKLYIWPRAGAELKAYLIVDEKQIETELNGGDPFELKVDVEEPVEVLLLDSSDSAADGDRHCRITIIAEAGNTEACLSKYDSLLDANLMQRKTPRPVAPVNSIINQIERNLVLHEHYQGRPIVISFKGDGLMSSSINDSNLMIGDLPLSMDYRPTSLDAPKELLDKRKEIVQDLIKSSSLREVPMGEISLNLIHEYLDLYSTWLDNAPDKACWLDVVSMHTSERREHVAGETAITDPSVILLTPLHPLMLAWQSTCQRIMNDAVINRKFCTIASLISSCSSLGLFPLYKFHGEDKQQGSPLSFIRDQGGEAYWGIFWNTDLLPYPKKEIDALRLLEQIGLSAGAVAETSHKGGVEKALNQIVEMFPGKADLSVGISSARSSGTMAEGLTDWIAGRFSGQDYEFPKKCRVYDLRQAPDHPTDSELQALTQLTNGAVEWYDKPPSGRKMEIMVLDQLVASSKSCDSGKFSSAVSAGALGRINVRVDYNGGAQVLEAWHGEEPKPKATGILGLINSVSQKIETQYVTTCPQKTHLRMEVNKPAILDNLNTAQFLAVSSAEVDPSCFIKSIESGDDLLWDYEMPDPTSSGGTPAGTYLLGKNLDSLREVMASTAAI